MRSTRGTRDARAIGCVARRSGIAVFAVTVGACASAPPPDVRTMPAGVHTSTRILYYEANALSVADLNAAGRRMAAEADADPERMRVPGEVVNVGPVELAGLTSPRISYAYDTTRVEGGPCTATNVRVLARSTIRLLHWTAPQGTDATIVSAWSRFMAQLTAHEERHAEIAATAARQFEQVLGAMSASSCGQLRARAGAAYSEARAAEARQQQELDRQDHGMLQWAYARAP